MSVVVDFVIIEFPDVTRLHFLAFGPCLVMQLVSILVLQSSHNHLAEEDLAIIRLRKRELVALLKFSSCNMWLLVFCASSSRCIELVYSV